MVIYFGYQEWDGPLSIHEMFMGHDEDELALIPDYKVNLIAPYSIEDKDFDKFHSSLKEVLSFIKYAKDEEVVDVCLAIEKMKERAAQEAV